MPEPGESGQTDEQLMTALARGSTEAFNQIFARYKQPLFGFFRRRLSDHAQADELTQETFIALLRAAPRYQQSALFRTYLYAIALNLLRAYRRKAAFRAMFLGSPSKEPEASTRDTLDTGVFLRHALGKLDSIDREILLLREFEQLSYAEIAELLKLPLNTVRSRLFRARTALRDLLASPTPKASALKLAEERERP
jgi:RNA polymerase sigma-70 factor, ECF subfamily